MSRFDQKDLQDLLRMSKKQFGYSMAIASLLVSKFRDKVTVEDIDEIIEAFLLDPHSEISDDDALIMSSITLRDLKKKLNILDPDDKVEIRRKRRAWVFLPDTTKMMFNIYSDKKHSYIKWNKKWYTVFYRPEYGEYEVLGEADLS